MSSDIVGIDNIVKAIEKTGKKNFEITRPGQTAQQGLIYRSNTNSPEDAANDFRAWADIYSQDGDNVNVYCLRLFNKNAESTNNPTDKAAGAGQKASGMIIFNIALNGLNKAARVNGEERSRNHYTRDELDEEVNKRIAERDTLHEIQRLSAQVQELSRQMEETDEEEIGYEEKPSSITEMREFIGELKNTYMQMKGTAPNPSNVAVGEPLTEEQKAKVKKEQIDKCLKALNILWTYNRQIGDDLMRIANIAKTDKPKFDFVISELRK